MRVSWDEIAKHNTLDDCWLVIDGRVYDVTSWTNEHPGGQAVMRMYAGKDCTSEFRSMHSTGVIERFGPNLQIGVVEGAIISEPVTDASQGPDEAITEGPRVNLEYNGLSRMSGAHGDSLMWADGTLFDHAAPQDATTEYLRKYPPQCPPPDVEPAKTRIQAAGAGRVAADKVVTAAWKVAGFTAQSIYDFILGPMESLSRAVMPVKGFPVNEDGSPTRVAVIGAGCSGLSAAWTLNRTEGFDFTVYESAPQVGGHSFTYGFTGEDGKMAAIDMGFIFAHHRSYLNLVEMMSGLGVKHVDTELSLNVDICGKTWATDTVINGGPEPSEMPAAMKSECDRFHQIAEDFCDNCAWNAIPFGLALSQFGFSEDFKTEVMTPTLITLFISAEGLYGMSSRFMFNIFAGKNKFVDLRSAWKCFTIQQGTFHVWARIIEEFKQHIRTNAAVRQIRRVTQMDGTNKVLVITDNDTQLYDHVIVATSGKTASMMLTEQTALEKFTFSLIKYEGERVVLHTDTSFLPPKNIRNFNYKVREGVELPELTGVMTQVSSQAPPHPMPLLTMNPMREPQNIIKERYCSVHVQGFKWLAMSRVFLPMIQGNGNVWYGASWCNFLGHSGGIDAGMATACRLGGRYQLKNEVMIEDYFTMCCKDMFGPRFDFRASVRAQKPVLNAAL